MEPERRALDISSAHSFRVGDLPARTSWLDRNYRTLMLASMVIELVLLFWIAIHTH
jgi:hypothetical protein